jgi:hypothetical protein
MDKEARSRASRRGAKETGTVAAANGGEFVNDAPSQLLTFAVRRIAVARSDWGAAMLAELAALRGSRARWEFALGCAWVAAFPPATGGLLQIMKTTIIGALLVSTALVAPLIYLELRYAKMIYSEFPYPLFATLWFVAAAFVVVAAPLIHAVRAGESVLARPVVLTARIGFLILAALFWTFLVKDQMPCFLGVPNCD